MKNNFSRQHLLYLRRQRLRKFAVHASQIGVLALLLGFWELAAQLGWIDSFITSSPSRIWNTFCELAGTGTLINHMWVSTWETLAGVAIGTATGYVAAVILWWNGFLKEVFEE